MNRESKSLHMCGQVPVPAMAKPVELRIESLLVEVPEAWWKHWGYVRAGGRMIATGQLPSLLLEGADLSAWAEGLKRGGGSVVSQ